MRTPVANLQRAVAVVGLLVASRSVEAQPLGTAFTYQGRLTDGGNPAGGTYDFQFVLMDAPAPGGSQVGPILTRDDVVVTNGLFTVTLDFGGAFAGSKRWLDVGVRPGASTGAYSILSPRQELTPSPNAAFSLAVPWTGVSGKPAGFADDIDNDSGGTITGVTAGTGLTGGGSAGAVTLSASLGGSGTATTLSRSDHDHFGQTWTGAGAGLVASTSSGDGLRGTSQDAAGAGVFGAATSTSGGSRGVYGEAASPSGRGVHGFASSTSGFAFGVVGQTSSSVGRGVYGQSLTTNGVSFGVRGDTSSSVGRGVYGFAFATSGVNYGVRGETQSSGGLGVYGASLAASGFGVGVQGTTDSPDGIGVYGSAPDGSGFGEGVRGDSQASNGIGVHGSAFATGGSTIGVRGDATSGRGVLGSAGGGTGVWGQSTSSAGFGGAFFNTGGGAALWVDGTAGIGTSAPAAGITLDVSGVVRSGSGGFRFPDGTTQTTAAVPGADITAVLPGAGLTGGGSSGDVTLSVGFGGPGTAGTVSRSDHDHAGQSWTSSSASGLTATSSVSHGLRGVATSSVGSGVYGENPAAGGVGVIGRALGQGVAVMGHAQATSGFNWGVWGQIEGPSGAGVYGLTTSTVGGAAGVWGESVTNASTAGYFAGRVEITGTVSKGGGSFKIDHPLDPENKYLYHSFVESPDMMNLYNGNVTTDADGFAIVVLPEWFEALNRDFRYQLTVIGDGAWARARVYRRIAGGRFTVQTDLPSTEVSWLVTGIRKDSSETHRIPVEQDKPEAERGTYLHPEAWGQPKEAGLDYKRRPLPVGSR